STPAGGGHRRCHWRCAVGSSYGSRQTRMGVAARPAVARQPGLRTVGALPVPAKPPPAWGARASAARDTPTGTPCFPAEWAGAWPTGPGQHGGGLAKAGGGRHGGRRRALWPAARRPRGQRGQATRRSARVGGVAVSPVLAHAAPASAAGVDSNSCSSFMV